jgi:hypothetical protein
MSFKFQSPRTMVVSAALLMSACGSAAGTSNELYTQALNADFAKQCIEVSPGRANQNYPLSIPLIAPVGSMAAATNTFNKGTTKNFDALVRAGLLSVTEGTDRSSSAQRPSKTYTLTAAGQRALASAQGKGTAFCAGHYQVDELLTSSPPTGKPPSTAVTFTVSAAGVPAWATSADLANTMPVVAKSLSKHLKMTQYLIQRDGNWMVGVDDGDGEEQQ